MASIGQTINYTMVFYCIRLFFIFNNLFLLFILENSFFVKKYLWASFCIVILNLTLQILQCLLHTVNEIVLLTMIECTAVLTIYTSLSHLRLPMILMINVYHVFLMAVVYFFIY